MSLLRHIKEWNSFDKRMTFQITGRSNSKQSEEDPYGEEDWGDMGDFRVGDMVYVDKYCRKYSPISPLKVGTKPEGQSRSLYYDTRGFSPNTQYEIIEIEPSTNNIMMLKPDHRYVAYLFNDDKEYARVPLRCLSKVPLENQEIDKSMELEEPKNDNRKINKKLLKKPNYHLFINQ